MFKRPMNLIDKKYMEKSYGSLLNEKNISRKSSRFITKTLKNEDAKLKEAYLHNLVNKWLELQEETLTVFGKLKRLIKKTKITLNNVEKHNLLLIEERAFSSERHIKELNVNIVIGDKEHVGARFRNSNLYHSKDLLRSVDAGELYFTESRIILGGSTRHSFYWDKIQDAKFMDYGFEFSYDDQINVIRIHDQRTLNNTINNYMRKKV